MFNFGFDNLKIGFLKWSEQIKESVDKKELSEEQANYICEHLKSETEAHDYYIDLLNNDVKSWNKAWEYVKNCAKKQAVNGVAMINDEVVLEWIDEYLQKEETQSAKKEDTTKNTVNKRGRKSTKVEQPKTVEKKPVKSEVKKRTKKEEVVVSNKKETKKSPVNNKKNKEIENEIVNKLTQNKKDNKIKETSTKKKVTVKIKLKK